MFILGISCFYHDSAVCLLHDDEIVGAAAEERFSREKNDSSFPNLAIEWVLNRAGISGKDLDFIGFYEKPILKLGRILETYIAKAPRGYTSFIGISKSWLNQKLLIRRIIRNCLGVEKPVIFSTHHQSHAASAFFASDFDRAAILTVDGVGEWSTTTLGTGHENHINIFKEIRYPHSLGLLYGAFTYYLGFRVNNDEYKVMGASAYGEPKFYELILKKLIDVKEDGSFKLNMKYFPYTHDFKMINEKFEKLFGHKRREPKDEIKQFHYDVAASIQKVTEDILLKITQYLYEKTKERKLCMAGGVALNSVANGKILEKSPFDDIFIQPAADDSGGAMGVAFYIYYDWLNEKRKNIFRENDPSFNSQTMSQISFSPFLGPDFSNEEIKDLLERNNYPIHNYSEDELIGRTAKLLSEEYVVAWFQGRMEWGPRALGNRSILATPLNEKIRDVVNIKVKKREPFRPFAPVVIRERSSDFFKLDRESPYMLLVVNVKNNKIPAVTHVDGSARVQTITKHENPRYYELIKKFGEITSVPILLNTSFNVAGEPLVCSPYDALRTFESTEIDNLVLGNFFLDRDEKKGNRNLVIK